jgi:16S rRNA (adenine1518-N6/adenine1519-N6)-dimethyltransferase
VDSPKNLLARRGLRPKKSWGQNFLADETVLERIADAAEVGPGDTVVELGAGLGHLTRVLAGTGASVIAVERDRDLVRVLEEDLKLPNVRVVAANATEVRFAELSGAPRTSVVGNLPYQLSGRILFAAFAQHASLQRAVFTLQTEVAERIASPPGGRDYGVLSVLLQTVATVTLCFEIPAAAFHPPPKVESSVVRIDFLGAAAPAFDAAHLERVVKAAFASRRKTLANTLSAARLIERAGAKQTLEAAGIDGDRRAETLSSDEFLQLAEALPKGR